MKALFRNLWEGKASTFAGAMTAALTFAMASGESLPQWAVIVMGSVSALLSFFAGPAK